MINDDFGLTVLNKDKITLLRDLNTFLIDQFVKGNQPVLIIDEAQNLDQDLLEEIRMLSNLETDNAKLLQIILVGQPELRKTLASATLVQLRQRISINCHIQPLSRSEIELYILHRLEKAGDRDAACFSSETINIIFTYSRGIPRLINIICDFILLAAFAEETRSIDAALVTDIIGDLNFEYHYWGSESMDTHVKKENYIKPEPDDVRSEPILSTLLKEINDRLDNLGKESESSNHKMFQEMTAKINDLEQSMKSHQEKTGTIIHKMLAAKATHEHENPEIFSGEEVAPSLMGSMFGRMFRF